MFCFVFCTVTILISGIIEKKNSIIYSWILFVRIINNIEEIYTGLFIYSFTGLVVPFRSLILKYLCIDQIFLTNFVKQKYTGKYVYLFCIKLYVFVEYCEYKYLPLAYFFLFLYFSFLFNCITATVILKFHSWIKEMNVYLVF